MNDDTTDRPIRSISYGGGVQSTALLVLAAQQRIDYPLAIMANVGDDSEHPASLRYVREIAAPYAEANGIELHLVDKTRRDGTVQTLLSKLIDPIRCPKCKGEDQDCPRCHGTGSAESRSLPIPVRMDNGAPGNRSCTADFKIGVTGKFLKARGATEANPATIAIGISLDEIQRANTTRAMPHERVVYPLIGIGDETGLKLTRTDCARIIRDAGLPVPPKSSCYFCPFHRPSTWQDMAREEPDLFEKSAALEDTLNRRRDMLGKDHVYLTRFAMPLREVFAGTEDQQLLPMIVDDANCDGGWCHT